MGIGKALTCNSGGRAKPYFVGHHVTLRDMLDVRKSVHKTMKAMVRGFIWSGRDNETT